MALGLNDLPRIGLFFVLAAIIFSVGADIVVNVRDSQTAGEYDYNSSSYGLEGLDETASWLPTIGLVV